MVEQTGKLLEQMRDLVAGAKAVPMSASCMVNRAELIGLIDKAAAALQEDVSEAHRVTSTSLETLERAEREAAQIIAAAEEKANFLASQTPVMEAARRKAEKLEAEARSEAEALRREADAYVDSRIAAFEAGLSKTIAQVKTMRERLAIRSGLDGAPSEPLPQLQV